MNQTLERNTCKPPNGAANLVSDLKERTEKYIDPALRYACVSWHAHLVDADTRPTRAPTITPTLRQFLETMFLFRLEVLSVVGLVRIAAEALQATASWLEVCQVPCFPRIFSELDLGLVDYRPCQRLFSFRSWIHRSHRRILPIYLPHRARSLPEEIDRTHTMRVIRPSIHESRA